MKRYYEWYNLENSKVKQLEIDIQLKNVKKKDLLLGWLIY